MVPGLLFPLLPWSGCRIETMSASVIDRPSHREARRRYGLIRNGLSSLVAATFASVAIAKAEPTLRVGEAEIIRNQVVSVNGAELLPIAVGDAVVRDEVVSTSANSDARIGLIDNTKLALGPNSTLKIDRAVYSEESRYKQIVISLTEGAFRFVRKI
jgi:hypothetical protein